MKINTHSPIFNFLKNLGQIQRSLLDIIAEIKTLITRNFFMYYAFDLHVNLAFKKVLSIELFKYQGSFTEIESLIKKNS